MEHRPVTPLTGNVAGQWTSLAAAERGSTRRRRASAPMRGGEDGVRFGQGHMTQSPSTRRPTARAARAARAPARSARAPAVSDTDALPPSVLEDLVDGLMPLALIDPDVYANPRGEIHEGSDEFRELLGSIEANGGVLQSVGIAPKQDGRYPLVFGWRRYRAARRARLKGIPVVYRPEVRDQLRALRAGATENTARQDMAPVAEARALRALMDAGETQRRAARILGMSERTARNRLKLLKLPADLADALDDGTLPLDAAPVLIDLGAVAPDAARSLVDRVREGTVGRGVFADPAELAHILQTGIAAQHRLIDLTGPQLLTDLPLAGAKAANVRKRIKQLADDAGILTGSFTAADIDAARAAGLLFEITWAAVGLESVTAALVGDREWLTDRVELLLDREEKQAAANPRRHRADASPGAPHAAADVDAAAADRQPTDSADEHARTKRAAARARITAEATAAMNTEIGRNLNRRVTKPRLSLPVAQLIGLAVLDWAGDSLVQAGLARTGVFTEPGQDGRPAKASSAAIVATLRDRITDAASPEEALSPLLHAIIAAATTQDPKDVDLADPLRFQAQTIARLREADRHLAVVPDRAYRRLRAIAERDDPQGAHNTALRQWGDTARLRRILWELVQPDPPANERALRAAASSWRSVPEGISNLVVGDDLDNAIRRAAAEKLIVVGTADSETARTVAITAAGRRTLEREHPMPRRPAIEHPDHDAHVAAGVHEPA